MILVRILTSLPATPIVPYLLFSSFDALMLQVHDQMMLDMFLRPLLLLLLGFMGYIAMLQVHDQLMPKL